MTTLLAIALSYALVGALFLSQLRGLVLAAGWLVFAVAAVAVTGPLILMAAVYRRLGLVAR